MHLPVLRPQIQLIIHSLQLQQVVFHFIGLFLFTLHLAATHRELSRNENACQMHLALCVHNLSSELSALAHLCIRSAQRFVMTSLLGAH